MRKREKHKERERKGKRGRESKRKGKKRGGREECKIGDIEGRYNDIVVQVCLQVIWRIDQTLYVGMYYVYVYEII